MIATLSLSAFPLLGLSVSSNFFDKRQHQSFVLSSRSESYLLDFIATELSNNACLVESINKRKIDLRKSFEIEKLDNRIESLIKDDFRNYDFMMVKGVVFSITELILSHNKLMLRNRS